MNRVITTPTRYVFSRRPSLARLFFAMVAASGLTTSDLLAQNETVNGNLSVTGTVDVDGNTFTFGTQSSSYGAGLIYADSDTDTLSFHLNRSTASWLWAHSSAINAMRLNASHELVLYKSDGSTAGITLTPATNTLSLGGSTLYRDGTGALVTNAALNVGGAFSATTFVASGGTITGGSSGLTLNAGGTGDQNVTVTPTGLGSILLNGNVGIGTTTPSAQLHLSNTATLPGTSPTFKMTNVHGNAVVIDAFTNNTPHGFGNAGAALGGSVRVLLAPVGGYTAFVGTTNNSFLSLITDSTQRLTIDPSGYVGIGTANPGTRLDVVGGAIGGTESIYARNSATGGKTFIGFNDSSNFGRIGVWNDAGGWRPLVLNEGGGNVGIGTSGPEAKLHVAGTTYVTDGTITIKNNNAWTPAIAVGSQIKMSDNLDQVGIAMYNANSGGGTWWLGTTAGADGSGQGKFAVRYDFGTGIQTPFIVQ